MRYSRPRRRSEVVPFANRSRLQVESLESRDLLSVSVGLAHTGIGYTGYYPPDTVGAVGPNYYVEEVNTSMAIYNKSTGASVSSKSLQSFFTSLGGIQNLSDPFVSYDQIAGKFFTGAIDYNNSDSRLDFAVSNTSDPTGSWTFHRYDMSRDSAGGPYLSDYPRFGYNRDAYVVTFNMFPNGSGGTHVNTLAISKSNPASSFVHVWPTGTISLPGMSPAVMHDAAANGPMWFVGASGGASIRVIKATGLLSNSPTITPYSVSVPSFGTMPRPRQPGGTMGWSFDTRIMNAAMQGGMLVAAHNTGVGGAARARWYEINTTTGTPTLAQSGQIAPASTTDTYFPSIDINQAGDLGMTYIESSSSEYMSTWVTGRTPTDAAGQMETGNSPMALHGTSSYSIPRAGDYSATSVDPSDNSSFWSANEYKGSGTWNTGFVKYSVGGSTNGPATQYSVTAVTSTVAGNPFTFTVTALDANNNVATSYRGTVTFSSADPQGASLPSDYTFTAADNGSHTFTNGAALYTAGAYDVTGTDTADGSITGSATVRVTPAPLDHFAITSSVDDSGTIAGNAFDVTVTAQDAYNNKVGSYAGTVTFSSQDPAGATLPADYRFSFLDSGSHTFAGATALYTAGTYDVTATDTTSGVTGSDYIGVTAAPATGFYIAAPSSAVSGTAFDVTVYAVDPYGNVDTNYGGTVHWTSTDSASGVVLPADYTFQPSDQGVVTYAGGVTLITLGDQLITATDTADGTITGSADVTVTAGPGPASRNGNAVLALAVSRSAPAVAIPATASHQTTALPTAAAGIWQVENSVTPARERTDRGLVTGTQADSLEAAVLDLVWADWNEGLNPATAPV